MTADGEDTGMMEITVTGMTCGHCAGAVRDALSRLPGVIGVAVDLATGLVRIQGEPESHAVRRAIEEEGYGIGEVTRDRRVDC